ncbi:MAG: CZB domain-containing protein [Sulfurimonas sp.]|nr:CZB domain-containing protein [Sulfurimonas sp.]
MLCKIDHILFKADALTHVLSEKYKEFDNHHQCRFGKWYEDEGKSTFSNSPSFKQIPTPHKELHQNVINTFNLIKDSSALEHKDEILTNFINMQKASSELFELLDSMLLEEDNKEVNK